MKKPLLIMTGFAALWIVSLVLTYEVASSRDQEVMMLLAEGCSAKEAAEKLFISPKTVENHRTNIMSKLGLHSTLELVRYAARLGLVDVDLWKE